MWFYSHVIFLLRDQWLIERLSEEMGDALVGNNFSRQISPITSKIYTVNLCEMKISMEWKERWLVAFLTLKVSQYRKIGSMISSSKPVEASSDCRRLRNALCLCSPVWPAQAEQERCPKSLAVDLPTVRLPDDRLGLKLGLILELSPQKSQHKLCGVWILF